MFQEVLPVKNRIIPLMAALCLLLTGCASLLNRSYSSVEPYTDRYWDSTAEDTLKAESYQDLVNSLLMLIEQRSEEGIIRYYAPDEKDSYAQALRARHEVQNDTVLGSYLLSGMSVTCTENDGFCTLTYSMTYRKGTQDISSLMALTDSQSLMDLLRLAVREEHPSITAQFISKTSRDEVLNIIEQLWQELYLDELEKSGALLPPAPTPDPLPESQEPPSDNGEETGETPLLSGAETPSAEGESQTDETATEEPPVQRIQFPPCPWEIHFYPDDDFPEIVEIILK